MVRQRTPYRVVNGDLHLDVAVPQLTGTPVLNRRLRAIADRFVRSFYRTVRSSRPGRYHAMTIGWQLLGTSRTTTGIQLWIAQQHGLTVTVQRVTVWYHRGDRLVLKLTDLVQPEARPALQRSVIRALRLHGQPARRARAALTAPGASGAAPAFGFSAAGDLVVIFAARALVTNAEPVSVRLRGTGLQTRLSAVGAAARSSAQAGWMAPVRSGTDCSRHRCVALTFDDGPGAFTAELVALLHRHRAPATFFVVGNRVVQARDLLRTTSAAGMEIGNHSHEHRELPLLPRRELTAELEPTSKEIAAVTGRRPTLLRPPYGARNAAVDKVAKKLGMADILWDVDTLDWLHADAKRVRSVAVRSARRGSIILMHDVNRTTVAAVPGIIADLRRQGYTLVTVTDLLGGRTVPGRVYRQAGE